jgi:hypothetical protein
MSSLSLRSWSRWHFRIQTEGVGFEPTVGFPTLDFESSALNRTQPPFLLATVGAAAKEPLNISCGLAFATDEAEVQDSGLRRQIDV